MWTCNTVATIRQEAKAGSDAKVIKAKLSLNWTGPFKIGGPSPAGATPDGGPLAFKLLYLDLPNDMPGADTPCRVSLVRCKPCGTPTTATTSRNFCPRD